MRKTKMNDAEQWLADLEAKAKAATPGPWVMDGVYPIYSIGRGGLKDKTIGHAQRQWDGDFISAANPATVLRLVAMVRWLADNIPGVVCPCAGCSRKCFLGNISKCEGDADAECWIEAAYVATEGRHDQN